VSGKLLENWWMEVDEVVMTGVLCVSLWEHLRHLNIPILIGYYRGLSTEIPANQPIKSYGKTQYF
jgi:hypothetical protein